MKLPAHRKSLLLSRNKTGQFRGRSNVFEINKRSVSCPKNEDSGHKVTEPFGSGSAIAPWDDRVNRLQTFRRWQYMI